MHEDHILYYEDGEVIFEEDSVGQEFYIIESGKVEISQRTGGRKTTIAVLEDGDFFGEMASLTDSPRSATATALGRAKLMCLSMQAVLEHMQASPQFTVNLLQTLVNRLRSTTSTLRTLVARMQALDVGSTSGISPEKWLETEETIKYLKEQIELKDKQLEHQQAIIAELSRHANAQQRSSY
jgi:CRP-like cAMP-binding protein